MIHAILEATAELEILYSDPDYMQESFGHWSAARRQSREKMQAAITAEYNPIWNKDGTIRETYNYGAISTSGNSTDKVAGFNSDITHNREQAESAARQEAHTDTTERIEQGNIGVTKSQEMVNDEMVLRIRWNMISVIVSDFKNIY